MSRLGFSRTRGEAGRGGQLTMLQKLVALLHQGVSLLIDRVHKSSHLWICRGSLISPTEFLSHRRGLSLVSGVGFSLFTRFLLLENGRG
jgi:hypothetical protein